MTLRQEVLRLVRDLLRTPGAREVRVLWVSPLGGQPARYGPTFTTLAPPSHVSQLAQIESGDEVTVYLEGHLAGSVPSSSVLRHINGKRVRAGCGPLPASAHVVRSAATGYLLRARGDFENSAAGGV